jgi:hypothetical protein
VARAFVFVVAVAACGVATPPRNAASPVLAPPIEERGGPVPAPVQAAASETKSGLPATERERERERVEMKPPRPTNFTTDLRALGLDETNLPRIEDLEPRTLRGVMKLMAQSLGFKCRDCHQEGDFSAPTRRKKIAAKMWDEFVVRLVFAAPQGGAGGPMALDAGADASLNAGAVFCDSCHEGRSALLDRSDANALAGWMSRNFVAPFARKDGMVHNCETCHVGMEMHLLGKWADGASGAAGPSGAAGAR